MLLWGRIRTAGMSTVRSSGECPGHSVAVVVSSGHSYTDQGCHGDTGSLTNVVKKNSF